MRHMGLTELTKRVRKNIENINGLVGAFEKTATIMEGIQAQQDLIIATIRDMINTEAEKEKCSCCILELDVDDKCPIHGDE